jgi:hypothetical protein
MGLQLRQTWQFDLDLTERVRIFDKYKYPTFKSQLDTIAQHNEPHHSVQILDIVRSAICHATASIPESNEGCTHCNQQLQCAYCATIVVVHTTEPREKKRKWYSRPREVCTVTVTALKNLGGGGDPREQPWQGHITNHDGDIQTLDPEAGGRMVKGLNRTRSDDRQLPEYQEGRPSEIALLQNWTKPKQYTSDERGAYPLCSR